MERFVGKVAVVTGASSGIGAGIAEKLCSEGLIVVGLARRVELIENLAEKSKEKPGKLNALKCDVGNEEELLATLQLIETQFGPIHVLVNNAGIASANTVINGYFPKMREVVDVNFMATVVATSETLKFMRANNVDGHIINISSSVVEFPMPGLNVYGCTKAAVNYFSEVVRKDLDEVGSKIKITVVSPGLVTTEMTNRWKKSQLHPKIVSEDIANSVAYILCTPANVQIQNFTIKPVGQIY